MSLKSIVRDLRDEIGSFSRRSFDWRRDRCSASASAASIDFCKGDCEEEEQSRWASLPPELLRDVVKRVEGSESAWLESKYVVACAAVCRSWRHLCKEIFGIPESSAKLTFPERLSSRPKAMYIMHETDHGWRNGIFKGPIKNLQRIH